MRQTTCLLGARTTCLELGGTYYPAFWAIPEVECAGLARIIPRSIDYRELPTA